MKAFLWREKPVKNTYEKNKKAKGVVIQILN